MLHPQGGRSRTKARSRSKAEKKFIVFAASEKIRERKISTWGWEDLVKDSEHMKETGNIYKVHFKKRNPPGKMWDN